MSEVNHPNLFAVSMLVKTSNAIDDCLRGEGSIYRNKILGSQYIADCILEFIDKLENTIDFVINEQK